MAEHITSRSEIPPALYRKYQQERMDRIREDGVIRRVECPKCGALVGEDCHTMPGWHSATFHAGRKERAGIR